MTWFADIEFSRIAVIGTIALAVALFMLFRVFQRILPGLPLRTRIKSLLTSYLPIVEILAWVFFITWTIQYFWKNNHLFAIGMAAILFLVIILILWFFLRDIVSGALFVANRKFKKNDIIHVGDFTGKIISFKSQYIIIETREGELVHLPYSYLSGKVITKAFPAENIRSKLIRIHVAKEGSPSGIIEKMRTDIMMLPWSSVTKEPQIKLLEETNESFLLEILAYAQEEQYFYQIENFLENRYNR